MFLRCSDVSDLQYVPILSAAAAIASSRVEENTNDERIGLVAYEKAASVIGRLRQKASLSHHLDSSAHSMLITNFVGTDINRSALERTENKTRKFDNRKISIVGLRDYKFKTLRTRCWRCGQCVNKRCDNSSICKNIIYLILKCLLCLSQSSRNKIRTNVVVASETIAVTQ